MTPEILAVAANSGLLLLLLLGQQVHHDIAKGISWTFGNRSDQSLDPTGERVARTVRNHVESAVMFSPVALAVGLTGSGTETTAWAATAFVVLRALYTIAYVVGIPYLRSVLWTGAIVSLCVVGWPLVTSLAAS